MRSKTFLVSNILNTLYSGYLIYWFGGAIIESGGLSSISAVIDIFKMLNALSINSSFLQVFLILLCIHIVLFILGCIISWIAYMSKKCGIAKFAAILFLIATICFPIYIFFGLPLTIIGFVAANKQKNINNQKVSMI